MLSTYNLVWKQWQKVKTRGHQDRCIYNKCYLGRKLSVTSWYLCYCLGQSKLDHCVASSQLSVFAKQIKVLYSSGCDSFIFKQVQLDMNLINALPNQWNPQYHMQQCFFFLYNLGAGILLSADVEFVAAVKVDQLSRFKEYIQLHNISTNDKHAPSVSVL